MMLKKGMSGPQVVKLQEALIRRGYDPGPVDGDFGAKTEAAVKMFEKNMGFPVDGVVGKDTGKWLGLTPLPVPEPGPIVKPDPKPQEPIAKPRDPMAPFRWMDKEVGVKEVPGGKHNPRILFYHGFTTLKATTDEVPWCSSAMCAAAEENGYKSTKSAAAASWLDFGIEVDLENFLKGDILVFARDGGNHVCFAGKDGKKSAGTAYCLGGNQSNSVCYTHMSTGRLRAVRRFPA